MASSAPAYPETARVHPRQPDFVSPDDVLSSGHRRTRSERRERREPREHRERHDHHHRRHESHSAGKSSHHHRHRERRNSHRRADPSHVPANGMTAGNVPRIDRQQRDIVNEHITAKTQQAALVAQARSRDNPSRGQGTNTKGSWLQRIKRATDKFITECRTSFSVGTNIVSAQKVPERPVIGKPGGIAVLSSSTEARRIADRPPPTPPKDAMYRAAAANQARTQIARKSGDYKVYVAAARVDPSGLPPPGPHPTEPDYRPTTPWPRLYLSNSLPPDHDNADYRLENVIQDVRSYQRRDFPEQREEDIHPAFRDTLTQSPADITCPTTLLGGIREPEHVPDDEKCHYCERRAERYMLLCRTCAGLGYTVRPTEKSRVVKEEPLTGETLRILNRRLEALASSEEPKKGSSRHNHDTSNDLIPPQLSIYKSKPLPQQVPLNSSKNPASAANPPRRKRSFSSGAVLQSNLAVARAPAQAARNANSSIAAQNAAAAAARFSIASNPFGNPFDSTATSPVDCSSLPPLAHHNASPGPDAKKGSVRCGVPQLHVQIPGKHASVHPIIEVASNRASKISPLDDVNEFYEIERRRGEDRVDPNKRQRHILSTSTRAPSFDVWEEDEDRPPVPPIPRHPAARNLVPLRIPPKPAAKQGRSSRMRSRTPSPVKTRKDDPPSPSSVYSRATRPISRQSWEGPEEEDMKKLAGLMRWEKGEGWDRVMGSVVEKQVGKRATRAAKQGGYGFL